MDFARAAVQVAVAEHVPLLAVLTGREFGEECIVFMEEACETMAAHWTSCCRSSQARGDRLKPPPPKAGSR